MRTKSFKAAIPLAALLLLALLIAPAMATAGGGATPGNLAVGQPTSSAGDVLKLTWDCPDPTSVGAFRVFRSEGGSEFALVHQGEVDMTGGNAMEYFDTGLRKGATYSYKVELVSKDGRSLGMTDAASGSTPRPVAGVPGGAEEGKHIIISIADQRAYFLENGVQVKSHLVCTGTVEKPTPLGVFKVDYHEYCSVSVTYGGVYCYWWMGFAPDTGMHALPYDPKSGTWTSASCLGSRGSHGCVRQATADAEWAYKWAPDGTRIDVIDQHFQYIPPPPPPPPIKGGHASQGISTPGRNWFLAEGCTSGNFDEYVLVMNPNPVPANVNAQFMKPDGSVVAGAYQVPANARYTIHVDNIAGLESTDVSTMLVCDQNVTAERAMYFDYNGRLGGSCSAGVPLPSPQWYFAEGYTGGDFDEFILLVNPQTTDTVAHATFMRPDGVNVTRDYLVKAHARWTIHVDDIAELKSTDVSTKVTSDAPIVAERSQYFRYNGKDDGNASNGITEPKMQWYLAEGYTGGDFDEYVLLQNPNAKATTANLTFMKSDGSSIVKSYQVGANSRYTVHVDEISGLSSAEVSTYVNAVDPVIVERSMYFNFNMDGRIGGSDAPGVSVPSKYWFLAEGYTGGQYDTYDLIMNPSEAPTVAHVNYLLPGGTVKTADYGIPAHSRYTIHLNTVAGLANVEVSTALTADAPVIVERSMYFKIPRKN